MTLGKRHLSAFAGLLVVGVTVIYAYAYAFVTAPYQYPIGTISPPCTVNGTIRSTGTPPLNAPYSGPSIFTTLSNSPTGAIFPSTTLSVNSISFAGTDPGLGNFTAKKDLNKTATNSTITSTQAGAAFPATSNLFFYLVIEFANQPGVKYLTLDEVNMRATLNGWPHANAAYAQIGSSRIVRASNPDVVVGTLANSTATVNGG